MWRDGIDEVPRTTPYYEEDLSCHLPRIREEIAMLTEMFYAYCDACRATGKSDYFGAALFVAVDLLPRIATEKIIIQDAILREKQLEVSH